MADWFPHLETGTVEGADHSLALTHTAALAAVLGDFLSRHPLRG